MHNSTGPVSTEELRKDIHVLRGNIISTLAHQHFLSSTRQLPLSRKLETLDAFVYGNFATKHLGEKQVQFFSMSHFRSSC